MDFWQGQQTLTVWGWVLRTVVTILWLLLFAKLMGQREIGSMTLFDFVVAITIGSVASSHLVDSSIPIMGGLITIAVIAIIDILLAQLALKNTRLRRVFQDEPLMLIRNGQILDNMLAKSNYNLDDLMVELRLKNYPNIHDVEFAFLEPNGNLSIIPKSQARPVTARDLNIQTDYEGMPTVLVEDGTIVEQNLATNNLTKEWLKKELTKQGVTEITDVMAVILDTAGRLYVSKKTTN